MPSWLRGARFGNFGGPGRDRTDDLPGLPGRAINGSLYLFLDRAMRLPRFQLPFSASRFRQQQNLDLARDSATAETINGFATVRRCCGVVSETRINGG